jgi:hypothetical protein
MILRRLAQNLREQNWTAITIEFVLLVAGVFLGIQVANWNEARAERQLEQATLSRLLEDYREIVQRGDAYLARSQQQLRLMARWIELADRGELSGLDQLRTMLVALYEQEGSPLARSIAKGPVTDLITTVVGGERRPEASVTFQQLVASGDLRLISDEALRSALARRSALREEAGRAIGFNHGLEPAALGSAFIRPTFQAASPNAEAVLEAALADPEFIAGLRGFYGMRSYNNFWFTLAHEETRRVLSMLEDAVSAP